MKQKVYKVKGRQWVGNVLWGRILQSLNDKEVCTLASDLYIIVKSFGIREGKKKVVLLKTFKMLLHNLEIKIKQDSLIN